MNTPKEIAITYSLYSSVRMIIGIFHTLYLLSTGVTLQGYAVLQFIFTLTIILSELLISKFSDQYSRKNSVILGVIFTIVYYILCLKSPKFNYLVFTSITYGLALSFVGGAGEGWIINSLDSNQDYPYYNALMMKINSIGSLFCGGLGYIIYKITNNYNMLYILSYLLMFIILLLFIFIPEKTKVANKENRVSPNIGFSYLIKRILRTKFIFYYFLLAGIFTIIMQIVLYYWQPIMVYQEKYDDEILLFCFLGVFLSQFLFSKFIFSIEKINYYKFIYIFCTFSILGFTALYSIKNASIELLGLLPYVITFGVLSIIPMIVQNRFIVSNPELNDISSSVMSVFSVFSRLLALLLFALLSLLSSEIKIINLIFIPILFLIFHIAVNAIWQYKHGNFTFSR